MVEVSTISFLINVERVREGNVAKESGIVLSRGKNRRQPLGEREEGEPEDRRREPVEKVLQKLDADRVLGEGDRVDERLIEVGDI